MMPGGPQTLLKHSAINQRTGVEADRIHAGSPLMANPPEDYVTAPTPQENFLGLLAELEQAIERNTIEWDATSAISTQQRLDRLAAMMRRIAAGVRDH